METELTVLQHTSPLPLYAQIQTILRQEIDQNYRAGDPLPPEPELEKRFGVSRITIRRALDELVSEGLIVRYQGRGTFVRESVITQDLTQLLSWASSMRRLGHEPQTLHQEMAEIELEGNLAVQLQLPTHQTVIRVRRLRGSHNEPICLMTNYVPTKLAPNLLERGLINDSLYSTLLSYGLRPVRVEDTVEARAATKREAEQLATALWAPLLHVTRISYDADDRPLDLAVVSSRADKYRYSVRYRTGTNRDVPLTAYPDMEER